MWKYLGSSSDQCAEEEATPHRPCKRRSHTAVVYSNGSSNGMYLFAGYTPSKTCLKDMYRFDFDSETWTQVACGGTVPCVRSNHTACVHKNYMYLFGGWNINYRIADFHKFNFEKNEWSAVNAKDGPCARSNHTCVIYKNSMWLFGGYLSGNCFNDFYEYNIDADSWRKIKTEGEVPKERHSHTAVVHGDSMWLMGGCHGEERLNDFWRYNFESNGWSRVQVNKAPKPRSSHTAVVNSNFMLVFGGRHGDDVLSDTWAFDFDAKVWLPIETHGTPPCGRSSHSAVIFNNTLYVFGGCPSWSSSSYLDDFYKLSLPKSGTLQDDLKRLIETEILADVTFTVSGAHIRAHKCVIAARCPRLAPQLSSDVVELSGFSLKEFGGILRYLYSDVVDGKSYNFKELLQLYRISVELGLNRCKLMCELELQSRINEETILEALEMVAGFPDLKLFAMDYFLNNEANLVQKSIQTLGSDILTELFRLRLKRVPVPPIVIPLSTFNEDIGSLLTTRLFSDCVCDLNGTKFHAHKCILACRSPYFEAAFRTQFTENTSGEVKINQFPSNTGFASLLEFIYTGKIKNVMDSDAFYVLSAISYYGLEDKNIQLEVTENNALWVFEAAESRPDLREKALSIIVQHFPAVSQQQHIYEMPAVLLAEILQTVGSNLGSGRSFQAGNDDKEKW